MCNRAFAASEMALGAVIMANFAACKHAQSEVSGNNPASPVDVRIILGADFVLPGTP